MSIDWSIAVQVASPIIALFAGIFLNKWFADRERVIAFQSNIASHAVRAQQAGQPDTLVNTHSLIVRNAGNRPATNVRVGHAQLPNFRVYPDVAYTLNQLPGGGTEIVFPTLVPTKEVTISYLYFPPVTYDQINIHVESDQGPAKFVNVRLQQVTPKWLNGILWALLLVGLVSTAYILVKLIMWVHI